MQIKKDAELKIRSENNFNTTKTQDTTKLSKDFAVTVS